MKNNTFWHADISAIVNRGFKDDASGHGGWLHLKDDDARGIKPGICRVGMVPFRIIDPDKNANKSVLVLHPDDPLFTPEASVPVGRPCGRIYLLHAACVSGITVGSMVLTYKGGDSVEVPIENDVHLVGHWGESDAYCAGAARAIRIRNSGNPQHEWVTLYGASIKNPHPDRTLKSLTFRSAREKHFKPAWIILAVAVGPAVDRIGLERRQTVRIKVGAPMAGCAIRRLHGTNLAPPLTISGLDITGDLKALNIPLTRLHDDSLENRGMQLVDISRVFPLFSADHDNPENYYFEQTDDYIANCLATGTKVMYRLGESIEHSRKKYCVNPPGDYEKWADICVNIIRHYNEGWANGFHHGIEYWAIWEEPNTVPCLWTGTWDDYIRLYVVAAKKIKRRFPHLKVGGPTMGGFRRQHLLREFLAACRREQAPLDFCAWTCYQRSIAALIKQPAIVRQLLDEHGFANTEVHLSEWHYFPGETQMLRRPRQLAWLAERMVGSEGAAFICAALSGWQDTPMDMANHYVGTAMGVWGLFEPVCRQRNKCYYAMDAFNRAAGYEQRLRVEQTPDDVIKVLAGRKANGETAILLSCFMTGPLRMIIELQNGALECDCCRIRLLDAAHDLADLKPVPISDGRINLDKPAGSAVFLIEFMNKTAQHR